MTAAQHVVCTLSGIALIIATALVIADHPWIAAAACASSAVAIILFIAVAVGSRVDRYE